MFGVSCRDFFMESPTRDVRLETSATDVCARTIVTLCARSWGLNVCTTELFAVARKPTITRCISGPMLTG